MTLCSGDAVERVYVVDEDTYIRTWGVYPGADRGKREVRLQDVAAIETSPYRLPPKLAEVLYRRGESGMGYYYFGLRTRDGRVLTVVTGNAVDFLPDGLRTEDVDALVEVARPNKTWHGVAHGADYHWCLYRVD